MLSPAIVVASAAAVFWVFRERRFYGDALSTVHIIEGKARVSPLGTYYWKEPLDRLCAMFSYRQLHGLFGWGGADSIAFMNAIAGAALVGVLWLVARRLGRTRYERCFLWAFPLTMGASQLLFGHVENYTLVSLGILVFIATSTSYLAGEAPLFLPVLAAAVALTVHGLASFLIFPMVALPFLRAGERPGLRQIPRLALAVEPGLAYLAGFYVFSRWLGAGPLNVGFNSFANDEHIFYSLAQVVEGRHLFSLGQLGLLTMPVGGVVLLAHVGLRREKSPDPVLALLTITTLAFLGYFLFFDAKNSALRDWDLLAPPALPLGILIAWLHLRRSRGGRPDRVLGLFAIAVSLAFSLPWIWSNFRP